MLVVKDGAPWLRECLRGLSLQTYPRLGVIAVDNGSTDGSKDLLVRALGADRVIGLSGNPGLPAAVREALSMPAAGEADYLLIHHDDVALDPEAITRMVEVAERIDGVGVVGPKIVDWDDPSILREVGLSTDRFGYPYSPLEQDEIDQGQYDRVREVLFVSSSAMLVSKAALDRTGPPDERFSSYHEDLDFCWRARLAGFRVVMTPLARARHRGASQRGERVAARSRRRARYLAERASLAAMLKNYGLLSLLWVLPMYAVQGVGKLVAWALSRRYEDVYQVLAAWGWNFLHLPGTIRRRVRAQSVRAVPDRSVRRYMAPATVRLRRWSDLASGLISGREERREDDETEADELIEPKPLATRAVSMARAHPVAAAWFLMAVVAVLAYRHLAGSGHLEGGALAVVPSSPTDYFRELLSGVRTTVLGGDQAASPALGFMGVLSSIFGASTVVGEKVLLVLLPPAAGVAFYRAFFAETAQRGAAVVGAACYALSSVLMWGFSEGRIPELVMIAALPVLAGRIRTAIRVPGLSTVPFLAGTSIVLAAGVAFYPGTVLPVALLLLAWLAVPEPGARTVRGIGLIAAAAAVAGMLVIPQAVDLAIGAGHGLRSTVGRPSFSSLVRLAPAGGPGSWSVGWFLPLAALLSYTVVDRAARSALRYLLLAVAAVFLAWASAAGYLPPQVSNTAAYLAVAALAYSALVVFGLASALPRMSRSSFGYRQLAVVVMIGLLGGGIGLQAVEAARGDWAVGKNKLPPAWPVVSESPQRGSGLNVLWLGRLSGDPFAPPGGDPIGTLRVGDVSVRYGLTGRVGSSGLDVGRDERGAGYDYLRGALGQILSGNSRHGGALLAPLAVRYVVAESGDLPREARRRLASQADLDLVPALGLTIFSNAVAVPEASFTTQPQFAESSDEALTQASALTAPEVRPFSPRPGGFRGRASGSGAVYVADQYASGWRASTKNASVGPDRAFGWAMRFPVRSNGVVTVEYGSQTTRRIEIAFIAVLWFVALWITRRPSRA